MSAVQVKRIKAYPISVQMAGPAGTFRGNIIKLVQKGFIVDVAGQFIRVNDTYQISFEIPISKYLVNTTVKVIKTYDRTGPRKTIDRLAELHFTQLSDDDLKFIYKFIRSINQAEE